MFVSYSGPRIMRANQLFKASLEITLQEPMEPGGKIAIAARHVSDLGVAQMDDPRAENLISVSTSCEGASLRLERESFADGLYRHPWNRGFVLRLERGQLAPGDRVTIQLGGERGFRGQSFVEERFRLRIGILPRPHTTWIVTALDESPGWPIVGAEPAVLRVHMTDINAERGTGTVCLKLEDVYGNPAGSCEAGLDLLLDDRLHLHTVRMADSMAEVPGVLLPADGTWHRLTATTSDGRFFARSNPFGPSLAEGYHLYWGEIHCQSGLCDGTNSPEYLYRYARHAAGLDFASVSSHDMELTPQDWEEIKAATRNAHRPGQYVTFLGYEWSGSSERGGDHNVYYPGDEGPLLYNGPFVSLPEWLPAQRHIDKTRTMADTISELGDLPALIIPHCGGRIANLDFYDAGRMPLFEIHSCHRSYEHVAQESIRRGCRFGFIGGSDDHRGALGDSLPAARDSIFSARTGLVAAYARELTRESLWEAFFAKRVYATNGCRIALSFRANNASMGSKLSVSEGTPVRFSFDAVLDGFLGHADLVRGSETLIRFVGSHNQHSRFSGEHTIHAEKGTAAYYLRIYQTDGGIAWSSPIWLTA